MANNTTGLTRIIKAAGYSWKGFRAAWVNEAAFRQEGVAAIVAVIIACFLDVDAITRVLLIGSVLLVMIWEYSLMNSNSSGSLMIFSLQEHAGMVPIASYLLLRCMLHPLQKKKSNEQKEVEFRMILDCGPTSSFALVTLFPPFTLGG